MPAPAVRQPMRPAWSRALFLLLAIVTVVAGVIVPAVGFVAAAEAPDHLVVSEVVTGAASASDELVELYNPTGVALPLEGLELVYVSASGATVTRRVSWPVGATQVPARGHFLLANDLGVYAPIADALYSGGMAATGGSVALRIQGASTAIDAVGWGTAASSWMEGAATPVPGAGESIERLPGGPDGSTVDSGVNAADFVVRAVPDPQNLSSPPTPGSLPPTPTPEPTPMPTLAASPAPTPDSTPVPTAIATPDPATIPIATARAMPDGTTVTVEGVSLTGSEFSDGGGYVADASGGLAVLPSAEVFPRGRVLRVTGEVDDRFGQRTLRVGAGGIVDLGPGVDPASATLATGAVGEAVEGILVRIAAAIVSPATTLTGGVAFDIDDGSGPTRLVVGTATGIETGSWERGTTVDLLGVVGQRDSTGTGIVGYRVQPRDAADIVSVGAPETPTPAPTIGGEPSATPDPSASPGVLTIAEARAAPRNARVRVRGTVTLPTGIVDEQTAAVQDATGAILLRLSDEAGALLRGQRVEVSGTRSTKSGMETIRVTVPPEPVGSAVDPTPVTLSTAGAGEDHEARLVVVRGGLVASARRASSGTVSMELDDGSGPLRVVAGASLELDNGALTKGTWVEVRGVLGQETTGAQPLRGYRVWPRSTDDIRVTAGANGAAEGDPGAAGSDGTSASVNGSDVGDLGDLGDLDGSAAAGAAVGATLVVGRWPQLGLGGVLWDGERLVGLALADGPRVAAALVGRPLPIALELRGLRDTGTVSTLGLPVAGIDRAGDAILVAGRAAVPPATTAPQPGESARWFAVVGRLQGRPADLALHTPDGVVPIDRRCDLAEALPRGTATVSGIALPGRAALIVPCGGIVAGARLERASNAHASAAVLEAARTPGAAAMNASTAPIAAGLIGMAALVLGGVAAWIRWRPDGPPPMSAATDSTSDAGINDPPEESGPSAPVLTLVPLPRERGP